MGWFHASQTSCSPSGLTIGSNVEIVARDQRHRLSPGARDRDNRHLWLQVRAGVVLADRQNAVPAPIELQTAVAACRIRRQWHRRAAWVLPVDALIAFVDKVEDAAINGQRLSAVLIDPRADIEWLGREDRVLPGRDTLHDDGATTGGLQLQPVERLAIGDQLIESTRPGSEHRRRDRRRPLAEGNSGSIGLR